MNFKVLRWVVVALLLVGSLAFVVKGANGPADPRLGRPEPPTTTTTTVAPTTTVPPG